MGPHRIAGSGVPPTCPFVAELPSEQRSSDRSGEEGPAALTSERHEGQGMRRPAGDGESQKVPGVSGGSSLIASLSLCRP